MNGLAFTSKTEIIYRSKKRRKKKVDATCDNKVFKATERGHQLTKRMLRGRASLKKKIGKCDKATSA